MTNRKRNKILQAKPGQLIAYYGNAEKGDTPSLCTATSRENGSRADGHLLLMALCDNPAMMATHSQEKDMWPFRSLIEELQARGYDLETLRFSIEKK